MVPNPHDGHEVAYAACHREDLCDAVGVGEGLGECGDGRRLGVNEDEGVEHLESLGPEHLQSPGPGRARSGSIGLDRVMEGPAVCGSAIASCSVSFTRYRCKACGNLTRFDVVTDRRTRAFHHYSVGGELSIDEEEVLSEQVTEVSCRWCGHGREVEAIVDP